MKLATRCLFLIVIPFFALSLALAQSQPDMSKIDSALERSGTWIEGVYLVTFPRPDLRVMLQGVPLSTAHVVSFVTFTGSESNAEVMGEICALPGEVTPAMARLRAGGFEIGGLHNHFLGESPRLMFIHVMARGRADELARAFLATLKTTSTPLGKAPAMATSPPPGWAKAVQATLGRTGYYLAQDKTFEVDIPSADFPAGPMDFWYESLLYFQQASSGRLAATGDVMVTARELNPVLTILLQHHFQIEAVHNHTTGEQPRVFFVHYWKIATPQELASGLKAALAAVHTREK